MRFLHFISYFKVYMWFHTLDMLIYLNRLWKHQNYLYILWHCHTLYPSQFAKEVILEYCQALMLLLFLILLKPRSFFLTHHQTWLNSYLYMSFILQNILLFPTFHRFKNYYWIHPHFYKLFLVIFFLYRGKNAWPERYLSHPVSQFYLFHF